MLCAWGFVSFRSASLFVFVVGQILVRRNVVPPTLPASCGIESARFRVLRVGGMPGRLLVRLLAVCLLLFHFAFVSKTGLPLQQSLS